MYEPTLSQRLLHVVTYRDLLGTLIVKEFKARYKHSLLGVFWAFLQPIILFALFIMLRSFVSIDVGDVPYAVLTYTGVVPWSFIANAIMFSGSSLVKNSSVITKTSCPRDLFPIATILTALIDVACAIPLLAGLLLWYKIGVSLYVLWVPFLLLIALFFVLGVGLLLSALGVMRRDIVIAIPIFLQFWMFLSPVFYPLSAVPERWRTLYCLNPTAGIIDSFHAVLVYHQAPKPMCLLSAVTGALFCCVLGYFVFGKLERRFADVI